MENKAKDDDIPIVEDGDLTWFGEGMTMWYNQHLKYRCVYLAKCGDIYKIGVSNNPENRVGNLNSQIFGVQLVSKSSKTEDAFRQENFLHRKYKEKNISGEWYQLSKKDVSWIINYLEGI